MSGIPDTAQQLRGVIEQVVGPVRELRAWWQPGCWTLEGHYQGQVVRYFVHSREGRVTSLSYGCDLGQRPIAIALSRPRVMVAYLPAVPLGAPTFEEHFTAHGWPAEVVREIFDPSVRQWLLSEPRSNVLTDEGCLTVYQELREGERSTAIRLPEPAEVAAWSERAIALTARAIAAFDQTFAAVAASQGQAAANHWAQQHAEQMKGREEASCRTLIIMIGVSLLLVIGLVLAFVLLWVLPRSR